MKSRKLASLVLTLGAVCLWGCVTGKPAEVSREPSPTGAVTEEEFQKLHTLKEEKAPPARGQRVEVAGTGAYLSLPEGAKAPLPAVLVVHEWWGLNEHIQHWADRLAAEGYAALAVDLYGGKVATTSEEALALVKQVDPQRALEVLKAAHALLEKDERVRATRTGVIGWCFGGTQALRLAMAEPELDAAVMYYGRPVEDAEQLKSIQAPLLAIFGTRDVSIPEERVEAFQQALDAAGVRYRVLRFEAEHAFANPSGKHYNTLAAAGAWQQAQLFLEHHLKR